MNRNIRFAVAFCLFALAGCNDRKSEPAALMTASPAAASDGLLAPEKAAEKAPDVYKARFSTTKGDFVVEVNRAWAPNGADRFYSLVKVGYFNDVAFFRAIQGFMVQFGIHGRPEVSARWREARIPDDPAVGQSNARGMVTFATAGPNTRTTQIFINYGNNAMLDGMGFTPFGKVLSGMEALDALHKGYGDGPPQGIGPDQGRFQAQGNAYLKAEYPQLDYIKTATLEP
jgi:peptidyl-prolyl cis-trans isomerase A (cyclophilin A)